MAVWAAWGDRHLRQSPTTERTAVDGSICRARLDQTLVVRGLVATRARARDLIVRGRVLVDGHVVTKPAQAVSEAANVALAADTVVHVSRAAEKLMGGLAAFPFECRDQIALDIGASTGGFTEVLLARGARRVFAVDVGHGQLHAQLRVDPRVSCLEATDARRLSADLIPEPITAIVADVSFISLAKALPAALALAQPGCWLIALIKPQFEVGPTRVGKGGIVRDGAARDAAVADVRCWLTDAQHWHVIGVVPSPITGGDGNHEFLIGAVKP